MNREIIEKIQKLLSLATSDNQHEAELASKKAQELLIKYNLSMAEVEIKEYDMTQIDASRCVSSKFIISILNKYFFVYIFKNKKMYVFNGTKENIEIALYVRSFLVNSFKNLYSVEATKQGWSRGANRDAFYLGLYQGLVEQLEQNKKNIDVGNKLIVVNSKLTNYVNSKHKIKHSTSRVNTSNKDAVNSGLEQGRNLKISKGIEQKNKNNTQVFLK